MKWLLLLLTTLTYAQNYDTIIRNDAYSSYISYELKQPILVKYKMYKGGGSCDRTGLTFKNDTKIKLLNDKDYKGTKYDKGHLVSAEDFAYDCKLQELTFRYYNCLPQYYSLNRGQWKRYESEIRKLSHKDTLLIITGGKWIKNANKMNVPTHCWKVVKRLKDNQIILVLFFENKPNKKSPIIKIDDLINLLGYDPFKE